ncbi:MAG: NUDIX hydrolase [Pseudomonadota bacterium]
MTSYPDRPLIGVGVVVFKGDRVLLIRRGKAPKAGSWSLPGGRQKLGETVRQAATREVAEETGVEIEILRLLDVVDSITRDAQGAFAYHYTLVDFLAEWRSGNLAAGSDAADATWADAQNLASYRLWDETERLIAMGLSTR